MIDKKIYSQVAAVIIALGDDYINRLPSDVFEHIKNQSDNNFMSQIDQNKDIDEQGLSKEAMAMIAALRLEYWCDSEEEKADFLNYLKINGEKLKETLKNISSARELLRLMGK